MKLIEDCDQNSWCSASGFKTMVSEVDCWLSRTKCALYTDRKRGREREKLKMAIKLDWMIKFLWIPKFGISSRQLQRVHLLINKQTNNKKEEMVFVHLEMELWKPVKEKTTEEQAQFFSNRCFQFLNLIIIFCFVYSCKNFICWSFTKSKSKINESEKFLK